MPVSKLCFAFPTLNTCEVGWDNMQATAERSSGDCIPKRSLGTSENDAEY